MDFMNYTSDTPVPMPSGQIPPGPADTSAASLTESPSSKQRAPAADSPGGSPSGGSALAAEEVTGRAPLGEEIESSEYGSHMVPRTPDDEDASRAQRNKKGAHASELVALANVTARALTLLNGDAISRRSPRLGTALLETGLAYEALLPRTRDEFQQQGGGLEEVVHELYGAFESRRRRHLTLVLEARERLGDGQTASSEFQADDVSTMMKRDQERKERLLRAEKLRAKRDAEKMRKGEQMAAERMKETARVEAAADAQRQARKQERKRAKRAAMRKQQQRERDAAEVARRALAIAEQAETAMRERDESIEHKRERHANQLAERSRNVAQQTAAKMERIAEKQAAREAERKEAAAQAAERAAENERQRLEKLVARRDRMAEENASRRRHIERRQLKNKQSEQERLVHERMAAETKLEEADVRLEEQRQQVEKGRVDKQHEQAFKERLRRKKNEQMRFAKVMASGAAVSKAEAKDTALREAESRKLEQMMLRKVRSQLKYEDKIEHVRRMHRVQEFEEGKHRELAVIKDQRLQGLVDSRKETLAERKRLAAQFLVSKQQLRMSISRENRRMRRATFDNQLRNSSAVELVPVMDWRGSGTRCASTH